jgi:hypothetical protein
MTRIEGESDGGLLGWWMTWIGMTDDGWRMTRLVDDSDVMTLMADDSDC